MTIIDKIKNCEKKYVEYFSKTDEQEDFIRFRDESLPDMYHHNYTWIKNAKDDLALIQLIESEIEYSKNENKDFCLIKCHIPISELVITSLSPNCEVSRIGHYLFDEREFSNINPVKDCHVLKVDNQKMVDDILFLDLESDEEVLGKDFCTRRVYRRKDVYLSNEGVGSYICYDNNEIIGRCDMLIYEDTAKIEDFYVSPQKQRKGYGTAILKKLIEIAKNKNVSIIYLVTDEDDTAKEMYTKIGFSKIYELPELLFKL